MRVGTSEDNHVLMKNGVEEGTVHVEHDGVRNYVVRRHGDSDHAWKEERGEAIEEEVTID